jgi:hypothetical protein
MLVALLLSFVLGVPGIGPETRQFTNDAMAVVLSIVILGPILGALVASWRWPALAAKLGLVAGLVVAAMAILDLFGVIVGPPPTGMVAVDALMLVIALLVGWRSWSLVRG